MEYRVCISSQFVMVMGKTGTMFQILLEKNFIVSDFFFELFSANNGTIKDCE